MEIEILRIFGKIRSKFNQQCKFIKRLFKVTVLHRKLTSISLNSKMFCLTNKNEITLCDLTYFVNVQCD